MPGSEEEVARAAESVPKLNDYIILEDVDHVTVQLVVLDHDYLGLLYHHFFHPVPLYKSLIARAVSNINCS